MRIYIDSEKGINLNDCEIVSNSITDVLDKEDYINNQYFLEVSSPGVERILRKEKHLKSNIGNEIQIKCFKNVEGTKKIQGVLKDFNDDYIIIVNEKEIKLDRKNISQKKTVYNW